ncbi:MAG: LuxR family transcriptional regulator [Chloroherpetonaceae bacterium]
MSRSSRGIPKKQVLTAVARLSIENKVDALLLEADKTFSPKVSLEKSLEAKGLAESIGYESGIVKSLHRAATNYGQLGDYENALACALNARERLKHAPDKTLQSAVAQTIGTAYYNLGDYETALRFGYESLTIAQDLNAPILIAKSYTTLGNTYFQIYDFEQARLAFEKCLMIVTEAGHRYGQSVSLNNLANVYEQMNDYPAAIEAHQKSLAIKEELGDEAGQAHVLISIGNCYMKMEKMKKAESTYKKSLSLSRKLDDKTEHIAALYSLGKLYNVEGRGAQAIQMLQEALGLLDTIKKVERLADVHRELSRAFEQTGDLIKALHHVRLHQSVREEMLNEEVISKTKKLQIIHQVAEMAREREIFRLKAEQTEKELAHKKQEIVSMAMTLVQKNELVEKLKSELATLSKSASGKASEGIEQKISDLIEQLDKSKADEKSWRLFEQQFESVHQNFIQTLTQRFPELTKTELRLCVLLKIQLSTKEIAQLLFLSPRSIETYRLHLRRKLGLSQNTNLTEFLLSL